MSDIIQLLPDSVANQIAAGEVVQRPASVVKELVENAIDAGATKIQIIIKDAGRTLIQIIDNGCGMSPADCRMAFERHATSKIRKATDLFAIHTMGFRGEALASIAAVAEVEVRTKRVEDELGTFLHIAASDVIKQEPTACSNGTNFQIKNLFFNIPARRKFLKSNATELRHIVVEIQRISLANPEISFSLHHNGSLVYDLKGENPRKRIVSMFGKNMNQSLVDVVCDTPLVKIKGYVGQPKFAKKTFGEQFLFVNNRYFKHPFFHKAVTQAYEKLMTSDMIPSYFLHFQIDPSSIDINIHPTKTEIKFEDERAIWGLLNAAVRESLGKFNVVPSIDFDQSGSLDIPVHSANAGGIKAPEIKINPNYNPFNSNKSFERKSVDHWQKAYDGLEKMPETTDYRDDVDSSSSENEQLTMEGSDKEDTSSGRSFMQFKNKYVLMPVKSGLMVIDQKRAHQRILFEQYLNMIESNAVASQQLLFPQTLELDAADSALLIGILDDLKKMGFEIREFGPQTFIVNGVPGMLSNTDVKSLIELTLEDIKSSSGEMAAKNNEKIAMSLAIASAIEYGQSLTNEETGQLIDSLFACSTPNYSPAGKKVLEIVSIDEIERKLR